MSKYFFHLTTAHDTPDDQGTELNGLDEARWYAVKMIAEVLCNSPEQYWEVEVYRVTVTDEAGLILFTVEVVSTDAAATTRNTPPAIAKRDYRSSSLSMP
jgi:hypothetical protein